MSQSSVWSNVKNEIQLLNVYPFLSKVATDSPMPIPGYLYHEINALTYTNDGQSCKPLVAYFISKMHSSSPVIQMKVLKMLLHLARNGHRNVKEEVKLHEVFIKQTADMPRAIGSLHLKMCYENIQILSKNLLETVFSEEQEYSEDEPQGGQKMSGYGSQATSNKLGGFGNTPDTAQSFGDRVSQSFGNLVDKILSPGADPDFYKQQAAVLNDSLPQFSPVSVKNSSSQEFCTTDPRHCVSELSKRTNENKRGYVAGRAGGGWDDSDEENDSLKDCGDHSISSDSHENKIDILAALEWSEEQKVVNEFAINEPLEKLRCSEVSSSCTKCSGLNCDKVCEFLINKLVTADEENTKLRCLVFLEYLLHYDVISSESVMRIAAPKLKELSELPEKNSVQMKSRKIYLIADHLNAQQKKTSRKELNVLHDVT